MTQVPAPLRGMRALYKTDVSVRCGLRGSLPGAPSWGRRRAAPAQGGEYAAGEKLFMTKGCMGCHSLQAVGAPKGLIGPNLSNIGSRAYIAAGWLRNTDENLERWIREPQAVKKGVLMPNLGVTVEEARALRAYLRAHQ